MDVKNKKIKSAGLKLAELRYYDEDHRGLEVSQNLAYGILYTDNENYMNIFASDEYPVFKRVIGTTNVIVSTGEEYGTCVVELTEAKESGPVWLIVDDKFGDKFPKEITIKNLEDYVLSSKFYFKDRTDIAKKRLHDTMNLSLMGVILKDRKHKKAMDNFFDQREVNIQKVK